MGNAERRKRARFEKSRRLAAKEGDGPSESAKRKASAGTAAGDPVRLFVALDLPEGIRGGLESWQAEALGDPALRPVAAAGLHVTLCFLGRRAAGEVGGIEAILAAIAPRPVELRFDAKPVPLPGGRPGLYALAGHSEAAEALQAELAAALTEAGLYERQKRAFWPHVTVARVRSERTPPDPGQRRGRARPKRVLEGPKPLPAELTEPFGCVRIALYRSTLKSEGAEYESLTGIDLPSPAGDRRGDQ